MVRGVDWWPTVGQRSSSEPLVDCSLNANLQRRIRVTVKERSKASSTQNALPLVSAAMPVWALDQPNSSASRLSAVNCCMAERDLVADSGGHHCPVTHPPQTAMLGVPAAGVAAACNNWLTQRAFLPRRARGAIFGYTWGPSR